MFNLGTRPTSQLFYLQLVNQTLVPFPSDQPRRYDELYSMQYSSYVPYGCQYNASLGPCGVWSTVAVYDWKWYSQLMVGMAGWEWNGGYGRVKKCRLSPLMENWKCRLSPLMEILSLLPYPPSSPLPFPSSPQAILNIARSIFLILLFGAGAFFLNHDTRQLVLR